MENYKNLFEVFNEQSFNSATVEMLTNRRYITEIENFVKYCNAYIIDARNCGGELLTLSTASFNKVGFTVKTFKGTKGQLSPELYIRTIRAQGKNGLNILLNCPLGIKITQTTVSEQILGNFGNWAFGNMTPVTEWGKILLAKEMGLELKEIGLQLLEMSHLTLQRLKQIGRLAKKLKTH